MWCSNDVCRKASGEERVMFTACVWRQCQLCLAQAPSACTHACICVCVSECVDDSAARYCGSPSAHVQRKRISGAHEANKRLLFWYFLLTVRNPCRWNVCIGDPVVLGSVQLAQAGERQRNAAENAASCPLRPPCGFYHRLSGLLSPVVFWHILSGCISSKLPLSHIQLRFRQLRQTHFRILTSDALSPRQVRLRAQTEHSERNVTVTDMSSSWHTHTHTHTHTFSIICTLYDGLTEQATLKKTSSNSELTAWQ